MDNKSSALPLIFAGIVIALIAGVSGWALRSRLSTSPGAEQAAADAAPATQRLGRADTATPSRAPPVPAMATTGQDPLADVRANDQAVSKLVEAGKQKLLSRYNSEPVDAAWAARKEQALERLSVSPLIEQVNAEPLSFSARCRSSVCLIGADFPSRLAADDWFTLYTMNAGQEMSNASSESSVNPDGSVHLQIYGLTRK